MEDKIRKDGINDRIRKTEMIKDKKVIDKIISDEMMQVDIKKINIPYFVSIPERIVRSGVSALTSLTTLMSTLLLPKALKESATYRVSFGMLQQFLVEKVAQVELEAKDYNLKENYVARKTAGSVLEGIGLVSIRFSPVWILAIISDVSGGSKEYLKRIIADLKRYELIDADTHYGTVFDLLEGIKSTSQVGVDAIDLPPITKEDFQVFRESVVQQYKVNNQTTQKMRKSLEDLYKQMLITSKKEKVSITKINGALTLDLMKASAKKGIDITRVTAKTSSDLINELIVDSYKESLQLLTKQGKRKYFINHMTPFIRQFRNNYRKSNDTLTEKLIRFSQSKRSK